MSLPKNHLSAQDSSSSKATADDALDASNEGVDAADSPYDGPSKSQRKRDMHALQEMGEELVKLPKEKFESLTLPDNLRDAVLEARRITNHEGRRRQMQYIGKLMRRIDTAEIAEALARWRNQSAGQTAEFHALERWRSELLEKDGALTEFLQAHPDADAQQLRTLIRNARKEKQLNKPPKSFRELFQYLKSFV